MGTSNIRAKIVRKEILSIFIPIILIIALAYVVFSFLIIRAKVVSASMEPFLMTGDTVYVNRLAYYKNDIQRGDIVWFKMDQGETKEYYVKRVIGLPGDKITFEDGYVFVNGVMLDESAYIGKGIETNSIKSFEVPENCYFLLGDNREVSKDCRYFENPYISKDKIVGKYLGKEKFWK